jgi:hypothetical protein
VETTYAERVQEREAAAIKVKKECKRERSLENDEDVTIVTPKKRKTDRRVPREGDTVIELD